MQILIFSYVTYHFVFTRTYGSILNAWLVTMTHSCMLLGRYFS